MTTRVSYRTHKNISFCKVSTENKPSLTYIKAFVEKPFDFMSECVVDYIKNVCYREVR